MTNTWGAVTSCVAVLTVLSAPWITQQPPANMLANEGATVTLKCVADGTPPLSYQWRLNGTNIPTATSDSWVLANLRLADGGVYSVRVTNAFGSVTSSNAVLTVNRIPIAQCREIILSAGDDCAASGSVDSGSFDPDGDPITLSQLPPAPYPLGTNDVVLTATDNRGGSNFCLARVIVLDTAPPSIVCPAAMVLTNAHDRWTSIINFSPSFADSCSGATIICTPPSGSAFGLGTHEVRCVAVDAAGNSNECSFHVTVWPGNQPPLPRIEATPLANFPGRTNLMAIAPNNANATLVFDGSKSFDPDDESFNYFWYDGGNLFSTNVVAVRILGLGMHEIVLRLDDTFPLGTNGASLKLDVISPAEAVEIIMDLLAESPLTGKRRQPLLARLRAAKFLFERSHFVAGVNQLVDFQNRIRAQVSPSDPLLGENLIQAAQTVIDGLDAAGGSKRGWQFRR